jgi:hypothetical protein
VKNIVRIAGVSLFTAIWFVVTGAAANLNDYPAYHDNHVFPHTSVTPGIATQLFFNATQAESEVNSFNNFPVPACKDPFSAPGAISKAIEQILNVSFAQYSRRSRDFPVHCRKSDIIFPFHYFW